MQAGRVLTLQLCEGTAFGNRGKKREKLMPHVALHSNKHNLKSQKNNDNTPCKPFEDR